MLDRDAYFIREHAGLMKLTDTYDILDPATSQPLGVAKEEPPDWSKYLRLLVSKKLLPTRINIYAADGSRQFSIVKPVTLFRSRVDVLGSDGSPLGYFKGKLFSIGPSFDVFDPADTHIAHIKGDWKGWNFKFVAKDGSELGQVTKKWAGMGKELFTSADNYMISLSRRDGAAPQPGVAILLLAAGLAVDTIFKEGD